MHERTPLEWAVPAFFDARIGRIRAWLAGQPETVVVLVGHGQLWKRAMNGPHLENVGIMECSFNEAKGFIAVNEHENPVRS